MRLVIHAPNIHRGGGRTLLLPLLEAARKQCSIVALLDQRLEVPEELSRDISITRVFSTISGRLAGEWALRQVVRDADRVLCFVNLPPLFKVSGRVVVFLQNRYLVDRCGLDGYPPRAKLRVMVERLWLRLCRGHANSFIVQTRSMQQAVAHVVGQAVEVIALFPEFRGYPRRKLKENSDRTAVYDFLYAATGEPHKNHLNLLEAWKLLASDGLYPSLCLTIPESDNPDLFRLIEKAKAKHKLNIDNVPARSWPDMQRLYDCSQALVYPSMVESFGLPLLEARQAGLPIIAAELDYVRDLVDPEESFDPQSPRSIARAIKRFLQISEKPLTILSSDAFVSRLLEV
jgi:glycosyltransferase involved in cell wall biosynthesis